jgi:hypothetical protein
MSTVVAHQSIRRVEISATVSRCGCTEEQKARPGWHARRGETCPNPRGIEDKGVIVRWHRNPLIRVFYAARRMLTGKV